MLFALFAFNQEKVNLKVYKIIGIEKGYGIDRKFKYEKRVLLEDLLYSVCPKINTKY